MLKMRDHDVEDYATLPDMDETDVGVLTDEDRTCLAEIGRYLVAVGVGQRFALWLLHKHFEPSRGEVFLERAITESRRIKTTPVARADYQGKALDATAVRFDDSAPSDVGVIVMEFAESDHFGSTQPLSADDEPVLAGVAERLADYGKTARFGLKLIRDPLDMLEHELLFETCDRGLRALYCEVNDRDAIAAGSTGTETSWRYQLVRGHGEAVVGSLCRSICVFDPLSGHESKHHHHHHDNM